MTPLELALAYIERGWNPLPVPLRGKRPVDTGWQLRIIDAASAARHFNGAPINIGVVLGPSSQGLTDVDLDCAEAVAIAPYILPRTEAIFGRASKRASHWLYYTDLSVTAETAAQRFIDPESDDTLLELRIGGDKGAQTIFPGSTHESGEPITWEKNGEPASADGLDRIVRKLAAYVLLARHWPREQSSRHHLALVVGGFLARAGHTPIEARLAVEAITRAAGDPEWGDRRTAAKDAAEAFHAGKHAHGYPSLRDAFGDRVADRAAEWLGYQSRADAAGAADEERVHENAPPCTDELISVCAANVEMKIITWLWPDRFAIGKLGIIAGLPDEGKGQTLAFIAAQTTIGGEWPMNEGCAVSGNVIVFSDEDDTADTLVPRFAAAGADLCRIHIIKMMRDEEKDRMFSLISDLDALRRKTNSIGDVRLVIIDPVSAYLGVKKIDSFRATDVRSVLTPLTNLAAEIKAAVVGVMHFNKRTDVTNALLRISDSLAFGAVARHVYGVIDDAENSRKLFVRAKNNVSAKSKDQTLAYRFGAREVGTDQETGKIIIAPYIIWEPNYVDVTAVEAMQAAADNKTPAARNEAKKFLADLLAKGPVPTDEIKEAAEANGISWATIRRAKSDLEVVSEKDRAKPEGKWHWKLTTGPGSWVDGAPPDRF
jgi:hypothetical protein